MTPHNQLPSWNDSAAKAAILDLLHSDRTVIMKLAELNSFDDREVKPANIALHVGRRPILAFGNSDGDLAMPRYARGGPGARLALLIHHDDAEREVAYDREFRLSPLAEALEKADQYGITLASMKNDWKTVFWSVGCLAPDRPGRSVAPRQVDRSRPHFRTTQPSFASSSCGSGWPTSCLRLLSGTGERKFLTVRSHQF